MDSQCRSRHYTTPLVDISRRATRQLIPQVPSPRYVSIVSMYTQVAKSSTLETVRGGQHVRTYRLAGSGDTRGSLAEKLDYLDELIRQTKTMLDRIEQANHVVPAQQRSMELTWPSLLYFHYPKGRAERGILEGRHTSLRIKREESGGRTQIQRDIPRPQIHTKAIDQLRVCKRRY